MNKLTQRFFAALTLALTIALPANLFAALEDTAVSTVLASVIYVDHESREILVAELEGIFEDEPVETRSWYYRTFSVGDDVAAFDYVRAGDRVTLDIEVSLAIDLRKATKDENADPYMSKTVTTKKGEIQHVVTGVCQVVEIDKKNSKVTFQGPKGGKFKVRIGPGHMNSIKKAGDTVVITYTQGDVVGIARAD